MFICVTWASCPERSPKNMIEQRTTGKIFTSMYVNV